MRRRLVSLTALTTPAHRTYVLGIATITTNCTAVIPEDDCVDLLRLRLCGISLINHCYSVLKFRYVVTGTKLTSKIRLCIRIMVDVEV